LIYYICHRKHPYTLGVFLAYFRHDFSQIIRIISYEDLFALPRIKTGTLVFTDFDRISATQHRQATEFVAFLESRSSKMAILNHPARAMGRFDLLSARHNADQSAPAVARLENWEQVQRFPVFIRGENDHLDALSGLITTKSELACAAVKLLGERGDCDDIIVVEFKNRPNADGLYEKYGAFRVGNAIYGQHLFQNTDWWVKDNGANWTSGRGLQSRTYVKENPHADELMPIFVAAGIEYGRIDYCMMDGKVVVFEINTNPVVNANPPMVGGRFDPQHYADLHNNALTTLPEIDGDLIELPETTYTKRTMTVEIAHKRMQSVMRRKLRTRRIRTVLRRLRHGIRGLRRAG
jgi:hypothetical protein